MRLTLLAAAALALAAAPAVAAPTLATSGIQGEWLVQAGNAKVKIGPCAAAADRLCGTISWLKEPTNPNGSAKHDVNNPDEKLQARPIMGLPMLSGFKADSATKWGDGKIYDPQSGKTYKSKLTLNPNGTLKVEGCVLMICQGQTWTKVG